MAYGCLYAQCPQCHDPIIACTPEQVFCKKCKIGVDPKVRADFRAAVERVKKRQKEQESKNELRVGNS